MMWKRLNNPKGTRQPAIGGPYQIETSRPDNAYSERFGSDINHAQSPLERGRAPPRPPRDDIPKGLPRLPFETASPPVPEHEDSRFRPVSSIYSQPSPNPATTRYPGANYQETMPYDEDVSPPSSPDTAIYKKSARGQNDNRPVSPIDEMSDISKLTIGGRHSRTESRPPSSNIPVLRREARRNHIAAAAANLVSRKEIGANKTERRTADVRRDLYSGEQSNSERGNPQSVTPGQFPPPSLRNAHGAANLSMSISTSVSAVQKPQKSFGERVRNMQINAPAARPEWKGASGRATTVSPVQDQMFIAPLNNPRKSSKRVASPDSGRSPVSVIRISGGETTPASAQMPEYADPTIRTVLANRGRNSPQLLNVVAPEPVLQATSHNAQPTQPQGHKKQESAGSIERNFREAFKNVAFAGQSTEEPYVQPPSRFSVTTYAPSEAYSTPRPSTDTWERPAMPTPPQTYTTSQQPSPIVNRKRPKVIESPNAMTRKAVPSSPVFISMKSSNPPKRASNITKDLPQSPAEAQSQDLVSTLEAQLDDLAHRKNNITRSIRQMTQLMPTDGVLVTNEVRRKRELEKVQVEGLREQEADVRRQEHDIGLRLHRAWKRRDQNAEYEPTGLWVRRVTG